MGCCGKKVRNIITGWKNIATKTRPPMTQERLAICNGCEWNCWGLCRKCFCVINVKIRVPNEKCPLGKWTKIVSRNG
ncbi:hypothetical protein LCGC14_1353590 [marine sediment metagenome]|uniref:Uncharacterized protein n=1 Tax=marine sediment metagenome TaxID=412755 RepID=A0A0F9NCF6_9ZZZZ